jgi:hypothetical protein
MNSNTALPVVVLPNDGHSDKSFHPQNQSLAADGGLSSTTVTTQLSTADGNYIETLCLESGACTCVGSKCAMKCDQCSKLTVGGLCLELNPQKNSKSYLGKFGWFFS